MAGVYSSGNKYQLRTVGWGLGCRAEAGGTARGAPHYGAAAKHNNGELAQPRQLTLLDVWSGSLLVMAVPASLQERLSYQAVGGPGSEAPTILWNYSHCTRITRQR